MTDNFFVIKDYLLLRIFDTFFNFMIIEFLDFI